MKLFDRYLLACTNQRIPMPPEWQESLGLALSAVKQSKTMGGVEAEITGYKFQQDDVLQRGFVNQQVKSFELDEQAKYLLQLYLRALRDHKELDFLPYLQLGTTTYKFPDYVTVAPIVAGRKYSVYGNTIRDVVWEIYLDGQEEAIYSSSVSSLSTLKPLIIDTSKISCPVQQEEFLMLRIISNVKVAVVEGVFNYLPTTKQKEDKVTGEVIEERDTNLSAKTLRVEGGTTKYWPVRLPSVAYKPELNYADKLIPALLDMQVTVDSPAKQCEILAEALRGKDTEEQIKLATTGLYDVDKYVGGKLIW